MPDPRASEVNLGYDERVLRFIGSVGLVGIFTSVVVACSSPPPKMVAAKDDGVPANSASEERLNGASAKPKPVETVDPSQPLTTPMTGDGTPPTPMPVAPTSGKPGTKGAATATARGAEPPPATAKGAGGPKASKAECKQLFDKYIDLTIGTDSRFEGIPPEMIAQMKAAALSQAQSEKGDPCSTQDVSRSQYTCAMGSTSTAAWQKCMK